MNKPSLWQLVKEDFSMPAKNDPAYRSAVELFFNYPGIWAVSNHRVAHRLHVKGWKRTARIIMGITQMITNIDLHPGAQVGRRVFFDHAIGVVVGETAIIGNDVLIYQGVTLGGVNLERDVKRHPTIKDGAVIGSGAKVIGDITIGVNCRIGSNSVVVKDVPDESTAVGIPARVIEKGRDKNPMAHNKIPDINKELFAYLVKRVAILEEAIINNNKDIIEKDQELEAIYETFIKTIKE